MEEIKVGDIVTLKSDRDWSFTVGSIEKINGEPVAQVYWFDGKERELKVKNVPVAALK